MHSIVFVGVDARSELQPKPSVMVYNYKKEDWQAMRQDMKNFKLSEGNKQQQWDSFEDRLHQMIDDSVSSFYIYVIWTLFYIVLLK